MTNAAEVSAAYAESFRPGLGKNFGRAYVDLSMQSLESMMVKLREHIDNAAISTPPRYLIMPPALHKRALRLLYYRRPMTSLKGARGRKRSLMWR